MEQSEIVFNTERGNQAINGFANRDAFFTQGAIV
jgi:hypothetical protein